jgi:undecaprenyl-diphosphatase
VTAIRALLLGVLQGATEFLPVSSSGHLVLVPWLLRWEPPGLAFDAVVHWGTASAVIAYFWGDWVSLVSAAFRSLVDLRASGRRAASHAGESSQRSLAWLIVLGTVPAVLAGYFLEDFFEGMFARPAAAAGFLLVTAALLAGSERLGRRVYELEELSWVDALVVGVGQALAILPGISRSGTTIAAGLARGMKRGPAARFSFLLATPIILGAGLLKVIELAGAGGLTAQAPMLIIGFVSAAAVGLGCIHILLRYLQRRPLYPFAAYCALFGFLSLLVWAVR